MADTDLPGMMLKIVISERDKALADKAELVEALEYYASGESFEADDFSRVSFLDKLGQTWERRHSKRARAVLAKMEKADVIPS